VHSDLPRHPPWRTDLTNLIVLLTLVQKLKRRIKERERRGSMVSMKKYVAEVEIKSNNS
jgi:hypothetical protein